MEAFYRDRSVVITGGAGGIGLATAALFLEKGAQVALIDIDKSRLDAAAKDLNAPGRVRTVVSDLTTPTACAEALEAVGAPVFVLVHCAGIFVTDMGKPAENRDVYDRTLAANLTNAYDLALAFETRCTTDIPARMVLVSSLAFRRGSHDHAAYSAAKGGIVGLVRAFARRWGPKIRVNGVAPGIILTSMTDELLENRGDELLKSIPLARFGEPKECASVIEFLCGPGASYMTSQVLNIDGGIHTS